MLETTPTTVTIQVGNKEKSVTEPRTAMRARKERRDGVKDDKI